jgi:hypothetical protein
MDLSEYAIMFVFVVILGAGIPGPGDASLIAAGALVVGLAIRAGLSKWRATRQVRLAEQDPPKVGATSD